MRTLIIGLLLAASINYASAETAKCTINIWDLNENTKYIITQNFDYKIGGVSQTKEFKLPGVDYTCFLYFHDLDSGTSIACEYNADIGHTYFSSDRTILKEDHVSNNLRFRHKSAHIEIKTKCK